MILEGFDREEFLRHYWQRKPLLIRHRGKAFADPVDADDLAGLSCEEEFESRLVTRPDSGNWQVRHGPFDEGIFASLGESNWTLLVQAVDQVIPAVAQLKRHFSFLPSWRIDDIMISYACQGGGVGPHYDQYDVFLIQGKGRRRWQIGERCNESSALRQDTDLRLLQDFSASEEYILEAGDILYLPPRYAHHGTSLGESLCYSVGFRAPSYAELLQGFSEELAASSSEDLRFEDPEMTDTSAGLISNRAIDASFEILESYSRKKEHFSDFFGKFVTMPRYPERLQALALDCTAEHSEINFNKNPYPTVFYINPCSRLAHRDSKGQVTLFADGEVVRCQHEQLPLVQSLCEALWPDPLNLEPFLHAQKNRDLVICLLEQGTLLTQNPARD